MGTTIMENRMEKSMENYMETGTIHGFMGMKASQK